MKRLTQFLLFGFIVFFVSCSAVKIDKQEAAVQKLVKTAIVNSTSPEFLKKYIKFIPEKYFKQNDETHIMVFENIPELEYSDTLDFVVIDNHLINFTDMRGLPDCVAEPQNCEFNVTKEKLLSILTEKNLLETGNAFIAKAIWNGKEKRFLWKATITKNSFKAGEEKRANGIYVLVNPANGEIIKTEKWEIR